MTWTPHRLPITFAPIQGEALDSWIEGYARRLHVRASDLLEHLGLSDSRLTQMVNTLTPSERDILAAATAVSPETLTEMTLNRFDGVAVTIDPLTRVLGHPPAWRRQAGSRFCPACLRDDAGRWQLAWRLPWAFACSRHGNLLLDTCPACRQRPRPHRPQGREPGPPGACTTNGSKRHGHGLRPPACAAALDHAATPNLPATGRVLITQKYVSRTLDQATHPADSDDRRTARQTMKELHVLSYKALRGLELAADKAPPAVQPILTECGGQPSPKGSLDSYDAPTISAATTLAIAAHSDDGPDSEDVLRWIVNTGLLVVHTKEPGRMMRPWRNCGARLTRRVLTVLDDVLDTRRRLAYATTTTNPRTPHLGQQSAQRRAASLPAMLWPDWSMRLIPSTFGDKSAPDKARAVLAAMTLIPGTKLSYRQAAALLGQDSTRASNTTMITAAEDATLTETLRALTYLAQSLDDGPAPIDYARRRALLAQPTNVDRAEYAKLSVKLGWRPPNALQLNILDAHLWHLLSGCPNESTSVRDIATWNPLRWALPTAAREFVTHQALGVLHRNGIDEPLAWQPPPPAKPNHDCPGIEPQTIDRQRYSAALTQFAHHPRSLARIAEATGLNPTRVRLYAETAEAELPEDAWNQLAGPSDHDVLDPDRLRYLYEHDERPLAEIARLSLASEGTIRRALTSAGVPVASSRPRRLDLSRDWLQTNYLDTSKSLEQVANETGHSRNTLRQLAQQQGIPTRRRDKASHMFTSWPPDLRPSKAVRVACQSPNGEADLRRVLAMLGHQHQRAAARALNVTEHALSRSKRRIERATGFSILRTGRPLRPSRKAKSFLRDAARTLDQLDHIRQSI